MTSVCQCHHQGRKITLTYVQYLDLVKIAPGESVDYKAQNAKNMLTQERIGLYIMFLAHMFHFQRDPHHVERHQAIPEERRRPHSC